MVDICVVFRINVNLCVFMFKIKVHVIEPEINPKSIEKILVYI